MRLDGLGLWRDSSISSAHCPCDSCRNGAFHPLEAQLQRSVDHALENSVGTIVVSEVESGKVLAQKNMSLAAKHLVRPESTLEALGARRTPEDEANRF